MEETRPPVAGPRPRAVLAVGNRLRGDDAVGPCLADALLVPDAARAVAPGSPGPVALRVFDAGLSPENYVGPVVELAPGAVLLVDACDFGGRPGESRLCSREEFDRLAGRFVSTHTLPLTLTVALIEQQLPVRIDFLAIQPGTIEFGAGLSGPVAAALPGLVELVRRWATAD